MYKGCSHGCKYCFAEKFQDISKIEVDETARSLKSFIDGKRDKATNWCDWNIPLHIGGLSDPFQPVERKFRITYECLKVLEETQYPFIISTKGRLVADEEYLSLLEKCNGVVQISLVCSEYDKIEKGCPPFEERLEIIRKISPRVKRVIVRVQPYMHEVFQSVFDNLAKFKDAGAYGVIIEGMKFPKKIDGMVKVGGDFVHPYEMILSDFMKLKEEAHRLGLKIYAGENRIRKHGDSLTCCGIDGLDGFKPNVYNLNHILNGDRQKPEAGMKMLDNDSGLVFLNLCQSTPNVIKYSNQSFYYSMLEYYKDRKKTIDKVMGVTK
jgi:DNA repair photolyase